MRTQVLHVVDATARHCTRPWRSMAAWLIWGLGLAAIDIPPAHAQAASLTSATALDGAALAQLDAVLDPLTPQIIAWRRDLHQHPELSGQEHRTAQKVAEHLRSLGLEVRTEVGTRGVVGILRGALPGKTVALRADMDALPLEEKTGLPFASTVRALYHGKEVPVMHACGHDAHVAMLMAAAQALTSLRAQLPGAVKFIFQPEEEGAPPTTNSAGHVHSQGAQAMVEAGAVDGVDAIYALHITANLPAGVVGYRSGPVMAGADSVTIDVAGKGGHGSMPWNTVDPVLVASQIVVGLQPIISRQLNLLHEPAVLTIGAVNAGTRHNIIPDSAQLLGSLRTFDTDMRHEAMNRITQTVEHIAAASGATATVRWGPLPYAVTHNPASLTEASLPVLRLVMQGHVIEIPKGTGSEDFSAFQKKVPGFYYFLGATPPGQQAQTAAPNHSPQFDIDERQLPVGARSLAALAWDFLLRTQP